MSKVEFIEIVSEVGESHVFRSEQCGVLLNNIHTSKEIWNGCVLEHKRVESCKIKIDKSCGKKSTFEKLIEDNNILKIVLHEQGAGSKEYFVNWCEGETDENSYQKTIISKNTGDMIITINENNK